MIDYSFRWNDPIRVYVRPRRTNSNGAGGDNKVALRLADSLRE